MLKVCVFLVVYTLLLNWHKVKGIKFPIWSGGPICQKLKIFIYAHISKYVGPNVSKRNYYALGRGTGP